MEKILIKIGTAIITPKGRLDKSWMKEKVKEIAELHKQGKKIILVSSGAVGAGMEILNLDKRPKDILKMQMLSGMGQPLLFNYYSQYFKENGIKTAQVLLTHHNFSTKDEEENIQEVINGYLDNNTIPIVNTNDVITKEELMSNSATKFSDNDELAALVAVNLGVDMLLILTDVEGLCNDDPKKNGCAELIEEVKEITKQIEEAAKKETNELGLGGMYSKVHAAKAVGKKGIITIVANGKYKVGDILNNKVKRTIFSPKV